MPFRLNFERGNSENDYYKLSQFKENPQTFAIFLENLIGAENYRYFKRNYDLFPSKIKSQDPDLFMKIAVNIANEIHGLINATSNPETNSASQIFSEDTFREYIDNKFNSIIKTFNEYLESTNPNPPAYEEQDSNPRIFEEDYVGENSAPRVIRSSREFYANPQEEPPTYYLGNEEESQNRGIQGITARLSATLRQFSIRRRSRDESCPNTQNTRQGQALPLQNSAQNDIFQ